MWGPSASEDEPIWEALQSRGLAHREVHTVPSRAPDKVRADRGLLERRLRVPIRARARLWTGGIGWASYDLGSTLDSRDPGIVK
jgi:hypothetical protein